MPTPTASHLQAEASTLECYTPLSAAFGLSDRQCMRRPVLQSRASRPHLAPRLQAVLAAVSAGGLLPPQHKLVSSLEALEAAQHRLDIFLVLSSRVQRAAALAAAQGPSAALQRSRLLLCQLALCSQGLGSVL